MTNTMNTESPFGGLRDQVRRCFYCCALVVSLSFTVAQAQTVTYSLGTASIVVGPTGGNNSVVLAVSPATGTWTAGANAAWLHLSAASQGGTGSANVAFGFDANPGLTRSATLDISGQILTITQAGSTYVPAQSLTTLVSSGLSNPHGVAVDGAGNVYIADSGNNAIRKWVVASNTLTTLVSSGLSGPYTVAVDRLGNVYIADSGNNAIKEWSVVSGNVTTLVSSELHSPSGVGVDGTGNVYIADGYDDDVYEWMVANSNIVTLSSLTPNYLCYPPGIAVDLAGNVFFDDTCNDAINEWMVATTNVATLPPRGFYLPAGVAVDGSDNIYVADQADDWIWEWSPANASLTQAVSGLNRPDGVAVDSAGNVYIADTDNNAVKELQRVFVDPTPKWEGLAAGVDALPAALPAPTVLPGLPAPSSSQPWLTITAVTNGIVGFAFTAATSTRTAIITWMGEKFSVTQRAASQSLGTSSLVEGPSAGADSVILSVYPYSSTWTASANVAWLHLSPENQSGTGCTNMVFTFDSNPGATRSGTLIIDGQTLTVTQAGSTYVATQTAMSLVSSGLSVPFGVGVDRSGNVYIADSYHNAVKKWTATNNTLTTLASSGLSIPYDVAIDTSGNAYIADSGDSTVKKLTANGNLTTLVTDGPYSYPRSVAVDGGGNVYFTDGTLVQWAAASGNVTTLDSAAGSVAVDHAGNNVYFTSNSTLQQLTLNNNGVTTLVDLGFGPTGIALDGSGNIYAASLFGRTLEKWTFASNTMTTVWASGSGQPAGPAVDLGGNLYFSDAYNGVIYELPHALVDPTPKVEPMAAGNDSLGTVLPSAQNLLPPFTPVSDQSWLTITGTASGVVSFSFTENLTSPSRTAHISLLSLSIPVTQSGPTFSLGTSALVEGPGSGSDSVTVAVTPNFGIWTASTNAFWLHLSPSNQSGTGSTNIIFSFDANPGMTRAATLTIAGQNVTVTQAGSSYVSAEPLTALLTSNLSNPTGVAVDAEGNVYFADTADNRVEKWQILSNTVTPLVSGLDSPMGIAVDAVGDVYIADTGNNAIKVLSGGTSNLTTLVSGLNRPSAVAVDSAGNVYIADTGNNAIEEFSAASNSLRTLVSGLNAPAGVAIDVAGNLYIADSGDNIIKEWSAASRNLTTLVTGLSQPAGVAVSGAGDVYIADTGNNAIKEWSAANSSVVSLPALGLDGPSGIAVDSTGNVYIADTTNNLIRELPHAFVNPAAKSENANAGNDTLPTVLPSTENLLAPFAPASSQSWLTVTGINGGVVFFSFTANTGLSRSAQISLLGQEISITQAAAKVSTPVFGPPSGTGLTNGSLISISCATPGAVIYYSTNGSVSTNSTVYTTPIAFTGPGPLTINALAIANGYTGTSTATATYSFPQVAEPVFIPSSGPITNGTSVSIACATPGATIYYTLDGSTPSTNSTQYLTALVINGGTTLNACAVAPNYIESAVMSVTYTLAQTGLPQFTPIQGPVPNGTLISITTTNSSATMYYTIDGSTPTTNSPIYTQPIPFTNQFTLQAQAFANGFAPSQVASAFFGLLDLVSNVAVTTFAGSPTAGFTDGIGTAAAFSLPEGICIDSNGNFFVSDTGNNSIRKILPSGQVITYAGNGTVLNSQSPSATNAFFNGPTGICVDETGNVYVADGGNNNRICKIGPNGTFSTFADLTPSGNNAAGLGQLIEGPGGNLYAGEWAKAVKIFTKGSFQTLAGTSCNCGGGWGVSVSLALDSATNLYAATSDNVWLISPNDSVSLLAGGSSQFSDGPALQAGFISLTGEAIDASSNIYLGDTVCIRKISPSGWVSTVAGTGVAGYADGPGFAAQFNGGYPWYLGAISQMGICIDSVGNLYVADIANNCIRKISFNTVALPRLQVTSSTNLIILMWPAWANNYILESSMTLSEGGSWLPVTNGAVTLQGGTNFGWTGQIGRGDLFYRLHSP